MKKRKTAILAFLLCAAVGLGVGYAAVSEKLNISGTGAATPSATNYVVKFKDEAPVTDKTKAPAGATVTATRTGDLAATFDVSGLTTKGEYVTATYIIENHSTEFKANVKTATVQKSSSDTSVFTSDYFTVTADLTAKTLAAKSGETIDSTSVTVKIELAKTPTEAQNCSFYVVIDTEAVAL